MIRLKLKRIDFWIYLIIAFILGILAKFCFSSPSSEARFETIDGVESGFIESISNPADSMFIGAGSPPQPAPTLTEQRLDRGEYAYAGLCSPRKLIVTAYCPNSCCCGEFADGITASGHIIQEGDRFVAAPPWIPFGTRLAIPGYAGGRMVSVEDRGGKIKGNRLDVFFDSHFEALVWGVKHFEVKNEKRN